MEEEEDSMIFDEEQHDDNNTDYSRVQSSGSAGMSIEVNDFSSEKPLSSIVMTNHSINRPEDSFVSVEIDNSTDTASAVLASCKDYVVRPYNILLKVIGWRSLQNKRDQCPAVYHLANIVYPAAMYLMLILACAAQVTTCFSRTKSVPTERVSDKYYVLRCDSHVVTMDIISYLMILIAYPLAIYTFRVAEPEHLSTLAETVFLSFSDVISTKSRKNPFFILLAILICGIIFFVTSAIVSIIRLFALRLDDDTTIISWFSNNLTAPNQSEELKINPDFYSAVHYTLVVIAYLGFLFFDLLYIAVTINYCSQCQLLTYYIENIQEKVRNKEYSSLNLAIKEIHRVYDFLKILNGKISIVTSLVMFIFVTNAIFSYTDLVEPDPKKLNIATGFLNTIQWLLVIIFPLLLAARLTSSGNELRRLGQEIAARPFYYSDTPDLELQFFLNFTESTRYQVNLAFIPMQPSYIFGFGFILMICFSSGIIVPQIESVTWF